MSDEPVVQKVEFPDEKGGLTVQARHPAFAALAIECMKMFKESGGVNYCEWTMNTDDPDFGTFTVLIQRKQGKTPAERVSDLEVQIKAWRRYTQLLTEELHGIVPPGVKYGWGIRWEEVGRLRKELGIKE